MDQRAHLNEYVLQRISVPLLHKPRFHLPDIMPVVAATVLPDASHGSQHGVCESLSNRTLRHCLVWRGSLGLASRLRWSL
jgi:hypothetical protein